jgi:uncharacterized protein YjbJ (UPF0337 family)
MKDELKRDLKGKVDDIKGRVKEAIGVLSGDKKQEAEGMVDRVKGAAEEKISDVERKIGKSGHEEADDE